MYEMPNSEMALSMLIVYEMPTSEMVLSIC